MIVGDAEVLEPDFARKEHPEGSRARLELWSEKAMHSAEMGSHQFGGHAIGEGTGIVPLKVVGHFRLKLHIAVNMEGSPAAEADEIPFWRCVPETKVVHESSDLCVIGTALPCHHWSRDKE
jgi:hypothetical protein